MSDTIPVHNGAGDVAFHIAIGSGRCVSKWGEVDPRRNIMEGGAQVSFGLVAQGSTRGLAGERITYFRVGGGDTVRLIEVLADDGQTVKEKWWDLYETRQRPHPLKKSLPRVGAW